MTRRVSTRFGLIFFDCAALSVTSACPKDPQAHWIGANRPHGFENREQARSTGRETRL
jgi:hypothetical protein